MRNADKQTPSTNSKASSASPNSVGPNSAGPNSAGPNSAKKASIAFIRETVSRFRDPAVPFLSMSGRVDAPFKIGRWRRAAEQHAEQSQDLSVLLLSGTHCSDHAFAFAEQFGTVIVYEGDDRRCAQLRSFLSSSDDPRCDVIAIVDSLAEGEALIDAMGLPFAFIQTGDMIEEHLEARLSATARKADYVVIQRNAKNPEQSDELVAMLDEGSAVENQREFNLAEDWDSGAKFPDWQRRRKFRDRMAAQYKSFALHARKRKTSAAPLKPRSATLRAKLAH